MHAHHQHNQSLHNDSSSQQIFRHNNGNLMAPQSMGHDVNNISVPNLEISHSPNRPKYITPYSD